MVLAALGAAPLQAATVVVDSLTDGVIDDANCTLREAVLSINAGADLHGCAADLTDAYGTSDTIVLAAGTYTLSIGGADEGFNDPDNADPAVEPTVTNTPDAEIGDLDLTASVRIVGAGSDVTTIQWDAEAPEPDRFFHVYADAGTIDVTIEGLTLTGGETT